MKNIWRHLKHHRGLPVNQKIKLITTWMLTFKGSSLIHYSPSSYFHHLTKIQLVSPQRYINPVFLRTSTKIPPVSLACPCKYLDVISKSTQLRDTSVFPFPIFLIIFLWYPYRHYSSHYLFLMFTSQKLLWPLLNPLVQTVSQSFRFFLYSSRSLMWFACIAVTLPRLLVSISG